MRISGNSVKTIFYVCTGLLLCISASTVFGQPCSGIVKPSISISTNSTTICTGKAVLFVATSTNSGANPSYQWKVNGINTGTNNDTFATSSLHNGDIVNCVLTVDPLFTCASPSTVASYGIAINVSSSLPPSISISASSNDVCPGTPILFTSSVQNTSSSVSYQWKLNGDSTVSDSSTFFSASLNNNDNITCILVDSNGCSSDPDTSNQITVAIKTIPSITLDPSDTVVAPGTKVQLNVIVSGNISSYQWQPADSLSNISSFSATTQPVYEKTNYFFNAITNDNCSISKEITIEILRNINMPNAFTPNGDGLNDVFRIPPQTNINIREFSIYNRWGNKIFSTSNPSDGWDGNLNGQKQGSGVYIYIISTSDKKIYKGSFMLIR